MDRTVEDTLVSWTTPECPFSIEYSARTLDDIRLAVVDAFHSLPHGGVEVGGVLLGRYADGGLKILDSAALECEHALGPSFSLSATDLTRLEELLTKPTAADLSPVGWYHSHTRSKL